MSWFAADLRGPDDDAEFACVCFPDGPCLGVPGESDACDACLRLDPEAACLREGAPGDDDV